MKSLKQDYVVEALISFTTEKTTEHSLELFLLICVHKMCKLIYNLATCTKAAVAFCKIEISLRPSKLKLSSNKTKNIITSQAYLGLHLLKITK